MAPPLLGRSGLSDKWRQVDRVCRSHASRAYFRAKYMPLGYCYVVHCTGNDRHTLLCSLPVALPPVIARLEENVVLGSSASEFRDRCFDRDFFGVYL